MQTGVTGRRKHGIAKVRGGSYCQKVLSRCDIKTIVKELRHADNSCLRCGRHSHWIRNCYAKKDVGDNDISDDDSDDTSDTPGSCIRCGQYGHWVAQCREPPTLAD